MKFYSLAGYLVSRLSGSCLTKCGSLEVIYGTFTTDGLKEQCHAILVRCKMLKKCLQIRKTPKIIKPFIYSGRCYYCCYTETKYCLLLRMARIEMDCILKKICKILARHLEGMAKNVLWMAFPAKN